MRAVEKLADIQSNQRCRNQSYRTEYAEASAYVSWDVKSLILFRFGDGEQVSLVLVCDGNHPRRGLLAADCLDHPFMHDHECRKRFRGAARFRNNADDGLFGIQP